MVTQPTELKQFLDGRLIVRTGDITTMAVDAIVNAANSSLAGGGGVDGAIHRAGGPEILQACREIRRTRFPEGLPTGKAVVTPAGKLPCRWVIHTVGPVWRGGTNDEERLLSAAYSTSISLAREIGADELAFPAISTGIYGFPPQRAACIVYDTIVSQLAAQDVPERVHLVFFSDRDAGIFLDTVPCR